MKKEIKKLSTVWGERLDPGQVWQEYPRPQLVRESYLNLNGFWDMSIREQSEKRFPENYEGKILVPFSPESSLSGVNRQLKPEEALYYRRTFPTPQTEERGHVLLHFGAVDQSCEVFINGKRAARHTGGYLAFSVDITEALRWPADEENELIVRVTDDSDRSFHARGKQKLKNGGMFYTAQSGIWQTVWMEAVPENYITGISWRTDFDQEEIQLEVQTIEETFVELRGIPGRLVEEGTAEAFKEDFQDGAPVISLPANHPVRIRLFEVHPWSPEEPYLYRFEVCLTGENGKKGDKVSSYFALRHLSVEKDAAGYPRLCLNHQPYFQRGVLDQGYWPEGLYTAPSDEAFVFDILEMKKMGINLIRKHAKIEPARWYYHCDRLGMLVWQDMVNGGCSYQHWFVTYFATIASRFHIPVNDYNRRLFSRMDVKGRKEFICEMRAVVRQLGCFPSIVLWTLFNEGWGQFDALRLTKMLRGLDPDRWIDSASGWFDQGCGDVSSIHNYFFRLKLPKKERRPVVLSEYGGYSLRVEEHSACRKLYGYRKFIRREELQEAVEKLIQEVEGRKEEGLCAAVYTQLSDIEEEVNGIFTYDRKVKKIEFSEKNWEYPVDK